MKADSMRSKKPLVALLLAVMLSGCAGRNSQGYRGENLILPKLAMLKDWQQFDKQQAGFRSTMWQKPGEMWVDSYAVTIAMLDTQSLQLKRAHIDQPGIGRCDVFVSERLEHPRTAHYSGLYWQTTCLINGRITTRMMHLMIQGKERFYHIQKAWGKGAGVEDMQSWKRHFQGTYLCDSSIGKNQCPIDN